MAMTNPEISSVFHMLLPNLPLLRLLGKLLRLLGGFLYIYMNVSMVDHGWHVMQQVPRMANLSSFKSGLGVMYCGHGYFCGAPRLFVSPAMVQCFAA
jgi:hypothetical protein